MEGGRQAPPAGGKLTIFLKGRPGRGVEERRKPSDGPENPGKEISKWRDVGDKGR